jgi:hypothetical protein
MTKFVTVVRDGYYWLAADVGTTRYFLHCQGKVGDRIRPGQRRDISP